MPGTDKSKVCQICKQDCSKKPRVKNSEGQYFCEECLAQKKAEQSLLAGADPAPRMEKRDEPASFDLGDEPDPGPPPGLWDEPVAAGAGGGAAGAANSPCPKCGRAMPAMSVVCVNCGFNTQGRGSLQTKVKKAVDVTPRPAKRRGSGKLSAVNPWLAFLILGGLFAAIGVVGGTSKELMVVAIVIIGLTSLVCYVGLIFGAFRAGATIWGILLILSIFLNAIPIVGLVVSLALLYYVFFVNQDALLKILYAAVILGMIALGVSIGVNNPDIFSKLTSGSGGDATPP